MIEILIPLLIISGLIFLNGLFVASEFGIVGVPRTIVETEADHGDYSAARVAGILEDPRRQDQYIATAQLGITLSSLGLGMYGEHVLAEWIFSWLQLGHLVDFSSAMLVHSVSSFIAIGLLTYLHVVLGEMVPKSIALMHPQWVAKTLTPAVLLVQWVFFPLVKSLNGIGNGFLSLFGIRRHAGSSEHFRTHEELALIVQESEKGGLLKREASSVFQELLEFNQLTAAEVMVPRTMVVGIPKEVSVEAMARILRQQPHSRYPVFAGTLDQIIGAVHVKDLFRCLPEFGPKLSQIIRPLPFVPQSATLEEVLKAMVDSHSQLAIVMDEQGGTAGLLTVEDLFEEVVGDIREDATERPEIFADRSGRLRVAGTARIENIGEHLGLDLQHEDVDTVSGLVLALLGRPAEPRDVVEFEGVRFLVTAVKGRGVRECIVEGPIEMEPCLEAPSANGREDSGSVVRSH